MTLICQIGEEIKKRKNRKVLIDSDIQRRYLNCIGYKASSCKTMNWKWCEAKRFNVLFQHSYGETDKETIKTSVSTGCKPT
jgi:hypothetical protein